MKHSLYKLLIKSLENLLFKKLVFEIIKKNEVLTNKLYKDLKCKGDFNVDVEEDKKFVLHHFGGRIENETYWKGLFNTFEHEMGWIWIMLSKKSHVILDIGANTGIYSLVAKTVNPSSEIYAFEPSRNTLEMVPLKWNYILCPNDKIIEFENEFQNSIKNA